MDFYTIRTKLEKDKTTLVYADWIVSGDLKDLVVNRGTFQAMWDESKGLWTTNEYDVQRLVDQDLKIFLENLPVDVVAHARYLRDTSTGGWNSFQRYIRDLPESRADLNGKLVFENSEVRKEDYSTFRLPYPLEQGTIDAWDEIVGTLYIPEERAKIEWAIGAIVAGDSVNIQKFLVFYGKPGSGKSTILNVIEKLFEGYTTVFNAKEVTSTSNTFSLAPFAKNPLVGIQQDGDLSRIEDSTQLNSITSHDNISINGKYAQPFTIRSKAFLFMASNDPVKIKNAKAGIMRRLIDVTPSNVLIATERYHVLVDQINFELGAIAHHCWKRYLKMGPDFYADYVPRKMQYQTDFFFNFIESIHDVLKAQDDMTLKQGWTLYKEYCDENGVKPFPMYKFRAEFESYFDRFEERCQIEGEQLRNYYSGYKDIMKRTKVSDEIEPYQIELAVQESTFTRVYSEQPAQYARPGGAPATKWDRVKTTLKDIDTSKLHFVKVPEHHIVIDFDLTDEAGEKDLDRNLEEASKWPPTYTEISKSGAGVHLHYLYNGDIHSLANIFDVGIEIKTLLGDSSLRRQVTLCNGLDIETISSGLPKKEKKMLDKQSIQSERGLRDLIDRNLRKEIHPGTKPSIDFIHAILEDAFTEGLSYDVRDMRPKILAFAAKSSNQAPLCIKIVQSMRFVGQENMPPPETEGKGPLIFFDVEVYPNLFIVCWKYEGNDTVVRMINPSGHDIEPLLAQKLVGFNNRRYDNHILYARYLGYTLDELYRLSQKLINNNQSALFGEAYNLSYADIYDFSSKKQGLKKFQIELGIQHMELDLPWDQPVDESLWGKVEDYCVNDVLTTDAVFQARRQDFVARQILADISGLSVNHTTQNHTARILFGDEKRPQDRFIYTDLSNLFEGYTFDGKESTYRGETVGEGGYVYAEPGIYENVTVLDIASMHPASIEALNLFGPYTKKFSELKAARMAIKHKDFDEARSMLDGKLGPFLANVEGDPQSGEDLAYALKIVINIVYGLTSARFDNQFRDNRNKDNIVAKRGALFMIDLKHEVQERGFQVVHIKTDSIKIPGATPEILDFIVEFGKKYGYDFELEGVYEKFCLVNDAVYIAKSIVPSRVDSNNEKAWTVEWYAVGKQFQHPYVYKTLFTHEGVTFEDLCEVRNVTKGTIYLDTYGNVEVAHMVHIGRTGSFVPVKYGGGALYRVDGDKIHAVTGTKGYNWVTREVAANREMADDLHVDMEYFEKMATTARNAIEQFGSYMDFVS
jgi:energy-coupling factor transporter ATP-binding protein EcfA2